MQDLVNISIMKSGEVRTLTHSPGYRFKHDSEMGRYVNERWDKERESKHKV